MSGTKIGGFPYFIQNGPGDYNAETQDCNDGARYIGQFVSLQFASGVPFPWCNREQPISLEFNTDDSIYAKGKTLMIGDMGSIYLFMMPDRTIAWLDECY